MTNPDATIPPAVAMVSRGSPSGALPPIVGGNRSMLSQSSGSSYTVLSNHTGNGSQHNGSFMNGFGNGNQPLVSITDVSLEQAMEKVQELAHENATLREYLKENNENMKKQFQMLLQWKEKVRESNMQNLHKLETQHRQISVLKTENDKYRQCLDMPEKQGSILEELQSHVRRLEEEKYSTQHEAEILRKKVKELKRQLTNKSPDSETIFVNPVTEESEMDAYKKRCVELATQVQNFHQQNEQLMQDLQQVTTLKQSIQTENSKLNEENLVLQKKLQNFLGDMNKTRHSIGGAAPTELSKVYDYTMVNDTEDAEKETQSSITAKQDIEILEMQTANVDKLKSGELISSEVADELREKLHLEQQASVQQKQKLGSQENMISRLQLQLQEKNQMLGHYKQQLDTQLAHVTQQHERQQQDLLRQLDGLNTELQHTKSSLPYMGDVQNLKSQVMSLIKESQELSARLEGASKALDKKSARVMELEQLIRRQAEEHQQAKTDADSLVQSLRYSLTSYEDTISRERGEHATTKKQLTELRASFNQLVNDYKELLDTFDEFKAQQYSQQQQGTQNKQQMDEINRLTAQTIAAEEAITFRDDQIKLLKMENSRFKDEIDNTIPVLKAQADVWKQDFDAERYARERQVAEKEQLLQEMKNLEIKNQQLLDELESYSRRSLAEMQRRHAPSSYQQQVHSHLQVGSQGQPSGYQGQPAGYPQQHSPTGYQPQQHTANSSYPHQQKLYPQQPVEHGGDEIANTGIQGPPLVPTYQQPHSHGSSSSHQEENNEPMTCPKCGISCPDLDTLQIHVIDCIEN